MGTWSDQLRDVRAQTREQPWGWERSKATDALVQRFSDSDTGAELCRATRALCALNEKQWGLIAASGGVVTGGMGVFAMDGGSRRTPIQIGVDVFVCSDPDGAADLAEALCTADTDASPCRRDNPPPVYGAVGMYTVRRSGNPDLHVIALDAAAVDLAGRSDRGVAPADDRQKLVAALRATFDFPLCGLVVVGRFADEERDAAAAASGWRGTAALCDDVVQRRLRQYADPPGVAAAGLWSRWVSPQHRLKWWQRGWTVDQDPTQWAREIVIRCRLHNEGDASAFDDLLCDAVDDFSDTGETEPALAELVALGCRLRHCDLGVADVMALHRAASVAVLYVPQSRFRCWDNA